ncbi:hypothetical protein [Coraliomargarita parva]|uniref:hypothetical protein n=1 Tax=Coraliomargarita parva TaxID=3014050 RepID=UPI0022B31CA9|nr:hypothetical protein [Coraliomargarita parva]
MQSKTRTFLIVGVDLLLLFVLLPLVVWVRLEFEDLQEALVFQSETVPAEGAAAADLEDRGPEVPQPDRIEAPDLPGPSGTVLQVVPEDPFVAEARRRAMEDPEAAMLWLQEQVEGQARLRGMMEVVAVWAAREPDNAMLWLESNAQGMARMETLYSGMEFWSKEDPISAAQWVEGMANDASKVTATKALMANWVKRYPEEASSWLGRQQPGVLRDEAAKSMVLSWAEVDPQAASGWALSEARLTGNRDLIHSVVAAYATDDPKAAEAYVREVNAQMEVPGLVTSYLRSLAEAEPMRAARWLGSLPSDDPLSSPENARVLMEEWSRTDSVTASQWLSEKADGPEKDAAILGFATTMLDYDPETVAAWTNTISDPNLRMDALVDTIDEWARSQPHQALKWVQSARMESDLRDALARRIGWD